MFTHIIKETKYKIKLLYSFIAIFILTSFLMNFISLPWLLQGRIIFADSLYLPNIIFLFVFSLLAAVALVLHIYKYEKFKDKKIGKGNLGMLGGLIGMFTSACSVCYPLILTLIGVPAALTILPFGGFEVQIISIALLLLSIYFVSKEIENCKSCTAK